MSVRIHQLSKQIGLENKELIALLQERGYSVRSASSSIDNISAESLVEEFKAKREAEAAAAEKEKTAKKTAVETKAADDKPEATDPSEETASDEAPSIKLPPGVFVKSAEDVRREREEKAAAAEAAKATSAPRAPQPPPPPPPARVAKTPPPPPAPGPKSPPAPPARPPATPPVARKSAPPPPPPAPERRPAAATAESTNKSVPPTATEEKPSKAPAEAAPEAAQTDAETEDVKVIVVKPPIVVRDFAGMIGLKPFRLISELMEMGIFASMNQVIEENVANELAARHGYLLDVRHRGESSPKGEGKKKAAPVDETKFLEPRPPVVVILGHVDHGKTTLIDRIRKANVVEGEAGGITQHIGAYQIESESGQKITFLDTPGHAAFSKMRARGTTVTDIAVLVVAADDGFMPQTDEALKHAQKADIPVVVAINKTDARGANIDRVKKQMQDRQIPSEDWGGETITVPISALKGEGISELLEMVVLQAEVLELKANPRGAASGIVVEAQIEVGRGPTATVIVQKGTLKVGDALVCGPNYCKVRAMFDDSGKNVKQAPPSTPVRVIGWSDAPAAGSTFEGVKNERTAKSLAEENEIELKKQSAPAAPTARPTLDDLFSAIESQKQKTFRAVVRCDVQGSLEAVVEALEDIKSDKVAVEVVAADVGQITQSDIQMAKAAEAQIIGFGVKADGNVKSQAKHHGVEIHTYGIIYELIDGVKEQMAGLLDPEIRETKLGAAEIRQIFPLGKAQVAGCLVTEGKIVRDAKVRLLRQGKPIGEGTVSTLKRFKDDVTEVRAGYECGIQVKEVDSYEIGDVIEAFELKKIRPNL